MARLVFQYGAIALRVRFRCGVLPTAHQRAHSRSEGRHIKSFFQRGGLHFSL